MRQLDINKQSQNVKQDSPLTNKGESNIFEDAVQENAPKDGFGELLDNDTTKSKEAYISKGDTHFLNTEEYTKYINDGLMSGFPFDLDYEKSRALNQSNWEQSGHALTRIIPGTLLEIVNQGAGLLDIEDYLNTDKEFGNLVSEWAQSKQEELKEALPIYRENPETPLDIKDFAYWMDNGSQIIESAAAFAALGYVTGGAALSSLTRGAKTLEYLNVLSKGANLTNKGQGLIRGTAGLSNAYLLNHAEGYGIAMNVYDRAYKEELAKLSIDSELTDEEKEDKARTEASKKASSAMNVNQINILLNLSSASLFLKAPSITRNILKSPSKTRSIKRMGTEGIQEYAEENINMIAENQAFDENYDLDKALSEVASVEGLESGMLGLIGGIGQTGLTLAGRNLKLRQDSESGSRISENQYMAREFARQAEALQKWDEMDKVDKFSDATSAYTTTKEQLDLQKQLVSAIDEGRESDADILRNKLLDNQAYYAFSTGTTERLIESFNKAANYNEEEAIEKGLNPKTYKSQSLNAINRIEKLEKDFVFSKQFINDKEVYDNRGYLSGMKEQLSEIDTVLEDTKKTLLEDINIIAKNKGVDSVFFDENDNVDFGEGTNIGNKELEKLQSYKDFKELKSLSSKFLNTLNNQIEKLNTITSSEYQEELRKLVEQGKKEINEEKAKSKIVEEKKKEKTTNKKAKSNFKKEVKPVQKVNKDTVRESDSKVKSPKKIIENSGVDLIQSKFVYDDKNAEAASNAILNNPNTTVEQKLKSINDTFNKLQQADQNILSQYHKQFLLQAPNVMRELLSIANENQEQFAQQEIANEALNTSIDRLMGEIDVEEDLAVDDDKRAKISNQVDMMLQVLQDASAAKLDTSNFKEIADYFKSRLGEDRFIKLYNKLKDLYNLTDSGARVEATYEELYYNSEEKAEIINNDIAVQNAMTPVEMFNMFESELLKENKNREQKLFKDNGFTVYDQEEVTYENARVQDAYSKIAYLAKNYQRDFKSTKSDKFNVLNFNLSKQDLDKNLNKNVDENLLDFNEINVGSKIKLVVLDRVVYDDGTIVTKEGLVTKDGVSETKDPLYVAPIGIEYDGKLLNGAFIHLPEWINKENVRGSISENLAKLINIRQAVLNFSNGIETTVIDRKNGFELIDKKGYINKTIDTLPDVELVIGKDTMYMNSKGELEQLKFDSINGRLYAKYPVNKNEFNTAPLLMERLSAYPKYINSVKSAINLYLNNNNEDSRVVKIKKLTGNDITTIEGLKQYLRNFVHLHSDLPINPLDFKKFIIDENDKYSFIRATNNTIDFGIGGYDTSIGGFDRTLINRLPIDKRQEFIDYQLELLEKTLKGVRLNVLADNLGKTLNIPLINDTEVEENLINYDTFIKENSYTDRYSHKLSNGTTIYTVQSSIYFDDTNLNTSQVNEEVQEEIEGTNTVSEKDNTLEFNINDDLFNNDVDLAPDIEEQSLIIKGIPFGLQEDIISHISAEVIKRRNKDNDSNALDYIDEFINNFNNTIVPNYQEIYDKDSSIRNKNNLDIINNISNSYPKLVKLVLDQLSRTNSLNVNRSVLIDVKKDIDNDLIYFDDSQENDDIEYNNWREDQAFRNNVIDKLSTKVKNLFSYIPLVSDFKTEIINDEQRVIPIKAKSAFNMDKIVPMETVVQDLSAILAYNNDQNEIISYPNYDILRELIVEAIPNKPYLYYVLEELDGSDEQVKNQFVQVMSRHYSDHIFGFEYNNQIRFGNSDSNSTSKILQSKWANGLKNSPLIIDVNGELIVDKESINEIIELKKDILNRIKNKEDYKLPLKTLYNNLGIDFDTKLINKIETDGIKVKNSVHRALQLLSNSDGFLNLYINRLKSIAGKSIEENPIFEDVGVVNNFSRQIANLSNNYYANSFKDVRGENYFAYSLDKFLVDRTKELKHNEELRSKLLEQPFSKDSYVLNQITNNPKLLQYLQYHPIDGYKVNKKGKKYKDMSLAEQEKFKFSLFKRSNRNTKANQTFLVDLFYPTTSDKATPYAITTIGYDFRKHIFNNQLDKEGRKFLFDNLVKPEINRIRAFQANPEKYNYQGMSEGGNKFVMFPELNEINELWIINEETGEGELRDILADEKLKVLVRNYLMSTVNRLVTRRLNKWNDYGFINNKIKYGFNEQTNREFSEAVKTIDFRLNKASDEVLGSFDLLAYPELLNYELNYLLGNVNAYQLYTTDPANYWKNNIRETFDNMGKRLAADVAPGTNVNNPDNNKFNIAILNDVISTSVFDEYYKGLLNSEDYSSINETDAQELTTLKEHLELLFREGVISEKQKNYFLKQEEKEKLDDNDFKVILGARKPVYVNNHWENGIERRIYIKSSSYPLIKQATKGLEIDNLRIAMNKSNIDRVVFKSAIKVGSPNDLFSSDTYIKDGRFTSDLASILDRQAVRGLSRLGHKKQQDIPYSANKQLITNPTQLIALITATVKDITGFKVGTSDNIYTGKEIQEQLDSKYNELYQIKYNELIKELDYNPVTNDIGNLDKLQNILESEAIDSYNLSDLQALQTENGEFTVPLWLTGISDKIESMLTSIIDNRIRKHTPRGNSFVLASSTGYKPILEGEKATKYLKNNTNITFDKDWYETSNGVLRPMRVEKGKVMPSEVIVPFRYFDNEGNLIKLSEYIDNNGYLDTTKIDNEVLNSLGFRIPTQGLNSMSYIKVVGFLPEGSQDLLLAPSEWTVQMGSDFDVDKLYSLMYHNFVSDTGFIRKYNNKDNRLKTLDNEILDLYLSIFKNPSPQVQKQIVQPLLYGKLKQLGNEIYPLIQDEEDKNPVYISEQYQNYKYNNARAGKDGISLFSNDARFLANISDNGLEFLTKSGKPFRFKLGGKNSNSLSYPYTNSTVKKFKIDINKAYQSLAVDNENEQGLHKLNINNITAPVIRTLIAHGFEEEIISYFINQPIVRDYVELTRLANDSATPFINVDQELKSKYQLSDNEFESYANSNSLMENISLEDLKTNLTTPNNLTQLILYDKLKELNTKGYELQNIQTSINTFNAGIGKDLHYSLAKQQQLIELMGKGNITNIEKLIGKVLLLGLPENGFSSYISNSETNPEIIDIFTRWSTEVIPLKQKVKDLEVLNTNGYFNVKSPVVKKGDKQAYLNNLYLIKPETIVGNASVYGTVFNNKLWKRFYPYNNVNVQNTINLLRSYQPVEVKGVRQLAELNKSMFRVIKHYLSSSSIDLFTGETLESARKRLFIDSQENVSLGSIILQLRHQKLLSNPLINRLQIESFKNVKPTLVKYRASVIEGINERNIYASFEDMLNNNKVLGTFNGVEYTTKKLAKDLILAEVIGNGVQNSTSYLRYIPINYLKNLGYYDTLKRNIENLNPKIIAEQTIQHNPELVVIDIREALKNQEAKFSNNREQLKFSNETNQTYLSVVNNKRLSGYDLYKYNVEDETYYMISTLGHNTFLEYNFNLENANSILPNNNPTNVNTVTIPKSNKDIKDTIKVRKTPSNDSQIVYKAGDLNIEQYFNLNNIDNSLNSFNFILNKIADNSSKPTNKIFAKQLFNNIGKLSSYEFIISNTLNSRGSHSFKDKTIKINPTKFNTTEEFEDVFLEEIIHAMTKEAIIENNSGLVVRLKGIQEEAFRAVRQYYKNQGEDIDDLLITMVQKLENNQALSKEETEVLYPFYNLEEFVGNLFKSKKLQEILNQSESKQERSIFGKFLDLVRDLLNSIGFNINKGSILEYAMSDIISLINLPSPSSDINQELSKESPVIRTIEFVQKTHGLVDVNGNPISITNKEEVVGFINRTYSNIEAKTNNLNIEVNKNNSYSTLVNLPVYSNQGVNTMRKTGIEHFGNPFTSTLSVASKNPNLILMPSVDEAVQSYKDWLLTDKYDGLQALMIVGNQQSNMLKQKQWILDQINQGKLDNSILLYMNDRTGYKSHAEALKEVIEQIRGNNNQLTIDYKEDFAPNVSNKAVPYIKNFRSRIKAIEKNINIATANENYDEVEKLKEHLADLKDRQLEVNQAASYKDLIARGNEDMDELEELFSDTITAKDTIYIKEITDFWSNLFDKVFDSDDRLSESLIDSFKPIVAKARQYRDRLHDVEVIELNKLIKKYGYGTSVQDIINNFKDINALQRFGLDISRYGNGILDTLYTHVKTANIKTVEEVNKTNREVEELESDVRKVLKGLGYNDSNLYEIFKQKIKNKKGEELITGHIVKRYSKNYLTERNKIYRELSNSNSFSAFSNYLNWLDKNTLDINLNLLFPPTGKMTDEGKKYAAKLKEQLGENHYNEYYKEQSKQIDRYKEQRQAFVTRLLTKHGFNNEEEIKKNKQGNFIYQTWIATHSPYVANAYKKKDSYNSIANYNNFYNHTYLVTVPKEADNYDNNFKVIDSNPILYKFYNYYQDLDRKLQIMLPNDEKINLAYYGIPYVPKIAMDAFRDKGMKHAGSFVIDAINKSIRLEGKGTFVEEINPIDGIPYRDLNARVTRDNRALIEEFILTNTIKYQSENEGNYPSTELVDEWRAEKINELSQDKSYDLGRIMKSYNLVAQTYYHKAQVEDIIKMIQNVMERQREMVRNPKGVPAIDQDNNVQYKVEGESFKNTKLALQYFIDNFYGITKKNEGVTSKKKLTTDEKARIKALELSKKLLKDQYEEEIIDADEYETRVNSINDMIDNIGGVVVRSKQGDNVIKYIQIKGMGWNFMSSIANMGFGFISNYVEAIGGLHYSTKNLNKAYSMLKGSTFKNLTFNKYENETVRKIRNLMDKWDILKDASTELYNNPFDLQLSNKHEWLAPYNLVKRAEYLNQAPLMIALMLEEKVKSGDKELSIWEALDENGNWKKEYGEEPTELIIGLKLKIDQMIKANHGNYDQVSALEGKKNILGRLLLQFRTWMLEGIANRVETKRYDNLLQEYRKGRFITGWEFITEYKGQAILPILKGVIKSMTFGKVFKGNNFENILENDKFDKVDAANMRKLMLEVVMYIDILLVYSIMHSILSGLDDEDDKFSKFALISLMNQGTRLKTDIIFYLNPNEFKNISKDAIPAISLITDVSRWWEAVMRAIEGDDIIESGVYSGHSRLLRSTINQLPLGSQVYKNMNYGVQSFEK